MYSTVYLQLHNISACWFFFQFIVLFNFLQCTFSMLLNVYLFIVDISITLSHFFPGELITVHSGIASLHEWSSPPPFISITRYKINIIYFSKALFYFMIFITGKKTFIFDISLSVSSFLDLLIYFLFGIASPLRDTCSAAAITFGSLASL